MLALGKLLDLTLAGREPTEKIQLTADGTRLHWLAEGALEVTPIAPATTASTCCSRPVSTATRPRPSNCSNG